MKPRTNRMMAGASLSLLALTVGLSTVCSAATKTPFSGTESHVAWLLQDPPVVNPSGNMRIPGWVNLWYDDADDDRLDGYDTVVIRAMLDANGNLIQAGGTFTVREKLDAIPVADLLSGEFDPDDIVQGAVLWEGVWAWNPHRGTITAVARNSEGLTAFYTFFAGTFTGYILDPHGE